MQISLMLVVAFVVLFWAVILGIFLATSRKQITIERSISDIEQTLADRSAK